ncbi:hypothetical protein C0580_04180 [Candidatus Parcubacteria bacterium]|nr:MAG: hypothetical protein C0580_04180 [Candidatus Parcubacteria bacterium]
MKKSQLEQYPAGSAAQVVAHAKWQKSRGRRHSMHYRGVRNPQLALMVAEYEVMILDIDNRAA